MIKHIFSDMDGTLLNDKGVVSEGNIETIRNCGIPFTLVSARAPMEMFDTIDKLNLTSAQIAFNGGLIYKRKNGSIDKISEHFLDTNNVQLITSNIRQQLPTVSMSIYTANNWYTDKIDDGIKLETSLTQLEAKVINYQQLLHATSDEIFKIMFIATDESQMNQLTNDLAKLQLSGISIQRSGNNYLEITSDQAKKSHGISYIQKLNSLNKSEMAAFGDGHNDIPMLKMVDTAIIMDNAMSEVKKFATHMTKSNVEDGVAYGIKNFLEV
ncbi:HAD family hydrolase [Companilactobacillus jidongensis]|uniref:HAD family hydrolase n=1 Tax=Companilactobacillus jidongensis TaxID=2486006 RepID=UPI000F798ADA|nr:HAD family hydrolase [Companilactobacillus jidongensis]